MTLYADPNPPMNTIVLSSAVQGEIYYLPRRAGKGRLKMVITKDGESTITLSAELKDLSYNQKLISVTGGGGLAELDASSYQDYDGATMQIFVSGQADFSMGIADFSGSGHGEVNGTVSWSGGT